MPSRYSVAVHLGRRGAGIGNEMLALAKAHIGARVLGAKLVEQPWWISKRRYGTHALGLNIVAPLRARAASLDRAVIDVDTSRLPDPWSYEASMIEMSEQLPNRFVMRHTSGMAGGFLSIATAKPFLQSRLGIAARPRGTAPRIGVHIRRGVFVSRPMAPGVFNTRLPLSWTENAIQQLVRVMPTAPEVVLHSDAPADAMEETNGLASRIGKYASVRVFKGSVVEDLRSLAASDFVVPAVSTFSMVAIFLSDAAYVWPREHLVEHGDWRSIYGFDDGVRQGPTRAALKAVAAGNPGTARGIPLADGETADLSGWARQVLERRGEWRHETDMICYGVSPAGHPNDPVPPGTGGS